MLKQEKDQFFNPVWHCGRNPAIFLEMTRIGVASVPVGTDQILLQNSECSWYGLSVPVYGGFAKMCTDFDLEG